MVGCTEIKNVIVQEMVDIDLLLFTPPPPKKKITWKIYIDLLDERGKKHIAKPGPLKYEHNFTEFTHLNVCGLLQK